nr:hypothetical protein GCM10020093_030830 [Planobispora longispora]
MPCRAAPVPFCVPFCLAWADGVAPFPGWAEAAGLGSVSAEDRPRPAGEPVGLGAAVSDGFGAVADGFGAGVPCPPVAVGEAEGVGAWVDISPGGVGAPAPIASTWRKRSSAVVPTSLTTSSWPTPGTEMTMLSPAMATSASEMPLPFTRSRMMFTARLRLSSEGSLPSGVMGCSVTVVPPARSRPYSGVSALLRSITPPMARMSARSTRSMRPGLLWPLVGRATGRQFFRL